MILVAEDPQTREVLRRRLERDGHYVLDESERPEGADPRHLFCELITTKDDSRELLREFRRDFASVKGVVVG